MEQQDNSCGAGARRRFARDATGFTLIELATVVFILAILGSLILSVAIGVRRHSRKVAARAEVSNLASAWQQFYFHYKRWPAFAAAGDAMAVTGQVARLLEGENTAGENPQQIPFMEFTRFNVDGDPVSPWGTADSVATGCYYFVEFDLDYDNVIHIDGVGDVRRSVIVWTISGHDGQRIGSWE